MIRRHVLSVIFLALVSANVIQTGATPLFGIFHHENLPHLINFLNIPRVGEYSQNFALSAAEALGHFGSYMNGLRTNIGTLNPNFGLFRHLINGGLLSRLRHPLILNGAADSVATSLVPNEYLSSPGLLGRGFLGRGFLGRGFLGEGGLLGRGFLGNYGTGGSIPGDAAASAAASAAATGASAAATAA